MHVSTRRCGGPCNISGSILQTALYEDYHVEHSIVHVIVIFLPLQCASLVCTLCFGYRHPVLSHSGKDGGCGGVKVPGKHIPESFKET